MSLTRKRFILRTWARVSSRGRPRFSSAADLYVKPFKAFRTFVKLGAATPRAAR